MNKIYNHQTKNDAWLKFDSSEAQVFIDGRKQVATVYPLQFDRSEELKPLLNVEACFATIKPNKEAR